MALIQILKRGYYLGYDMEEICIVGMAFSAFKKEKNMWYALVLRCVGNTWVMTAENRFGGGLVEADQEKAIEELKEIRRNFNKGLYEVEMMAYIREKKQEISNKLEANEREIADKVEAKRLITEKKKIVSKKKEGRKVKCPKKR